VLIRRAILPGGLGCGSLARPIDAQRNRVQMTDKLFPNEIAVVTGAASNIGRGMAVALANEGAHVLITDIDSGRLAQVEADIKAAGGHCSSVVADLSSKGGWQDIVSAAGSRAPDIFVHSACPRRHEVDLVLDVSEETFDAMLNTNVRSGFLLARAFAAQMKTADNGGRILFITSLHAETPRNLPHYSASKAGMTMLMKEMARQLGPSGIRVNAIAPGAIPGGGFATSDDAFQPKKKIPLGRFGTPEDVSGPALALLSNRFSKYVTGVTLPVDGGLQLFSWIDAPYEAN
jgi:NAD(P)-dependent dehydrogenase (short-subunit alcohol dehydrogenase family)